MSYVREDKDTLAIALFKISTLTDCPYTFRHVYLSSSFSPLLPDVLHARVAIIFSELMLKRF